MRFRRRCLTAGVSLGPPQLRECDARRKASRSARHPAARSTRRTLWLRIYARPASERRRRGTLPRRPRPTNGNWSVATTARPLSGWWGTSRSDRQAAGVLVARGRRARLAQPQGAIDGAAQATLRNLRARVECYAQNDARRDGRGERCPAARSGAGDGPGVGSSTPAAHVLTMPHAAPSVPSSRRLHDVIPERSAVLPRHPVAHRSPAGQSRHARGADSPAPCGATCGSSCPIRASSRFRAWSGGRSCTASSSRVRPRKSAAKYASIWTERGSPLMAALGAQATLLRGYLGERGVDADVVPARCATASRRSPRCWLSCAAAHATGCSCCRCIRSTRPATTATVVRRAVRRVEAHAATCPRCAGCKHFHDDPGYIDALPQSVRDALEGPRPRRTGGKLVMSFHGVPKRTLALGDPYHCECQKTGAPAGRAPRAGEGDVRRHVPVALRQGRVAAALHRADAGSTGARRRARASTWSARASSPTASRRSRRSRWRGAESSWGPAGGAGTSRASMRSPCLIHARRGSRISTGRAGTSLVASGAPARPKRGHSHAGATGGAPDETRGVAERRRRRRAEAL